MMNKEWLSNAALSLDATEREMMKLLLMRTSLDTSLASYKLRIPPDRIQEALGRLVSLRIIAFSETGLKIKRLISSEDVLNLLKEAKNNE